MIRDDRVQLSVKMVREKFYPYALERAVQESTLIGKSIKFYFGK